MTAADPGQIDPLERLLFDCLAGRQQTPSERSRLSHLLTLAQEERLAPLLYYRLGERGALGPIPHSFREKLEIGFRESSVRNGVYQLVLERLLNRLEHHGVEALILKGFSLAVADYPHPGCRPMGDLDILVRPDSLTEAIEGLEGAGMALHPSVTSAEVVAGLHHHVVLTRPDHYPRVVELHTRLMQVDPGAVSGRQEGELLFTRSKKIRLGGTRASVLDSMDQLIYLAAHLARHVANGTARLQWWVDLDLLLRNRQSRIQWSILEGRATELGLEYPIGWVLPALHARMGSPMPRRWQHQRRLRSDERSRFLFGPGPDPGRNQTDRIWLIWRSLPGMKARLRLLQGRLLSGHVRLRYAYPHMAHRSYPHLILKRWRGDILKVGKLILRWVSRGPGYR